MKESGMETDKQLYKLFTAAPAQLYRLLGLPVPSDVHARAETFKDVQTEADLVVEPVEELEPARLVEFQAYRDKRFVPKVMLRCALYRLQHPARSMRCHVIYLDREFESVPVDDGGLFQPTVHYLPELLRQLTIQYPDSPLLSVLRPLVADSEATLIATALADHERIRQAPGLTDEQRQAWLDVFHCWLMIRLPLKLEEIRKMIARLPEVEETPWGQELKERWTAEAQAKAAEARANDLRQMIRRRDEELKYYDELFRNGVLSEAAFRDLTARAERELQHYRADLERLEHRSA
jgi:predicted transposase YdaD